MTHNETLQRVKVGEVTLVGQVTGALRFGFTERSGGVSLPPYASLNLGDHVGDDPAAVAENRRRVLAAFGMEHLTERLLVPNQVHGDTVVELTQDGDDALDAVRARIAQGADAIVCTVPHVPVMLCFADCVPVILTCPNGFAVVHSGWKGTYARIAGKAAEALSRAAHVEPCDISAWIGPHILGDEYEVSAELLHIFSLQFDKIGICEHNMLDLSSAIRQTLEEIGVRSCEIHDSRLSTLHLPTRFFSYRGEGGRCGRHGAVAALM